jgi:hypothetical protein
MRINAHNLNSFVEIIAEREDYGFHHMTAKLSKVLPTILVLSSAHDCAHASV